MSYCLNPTCKAPDNTEVDECSSCGTVLRLSQRYEALKPIGQGGFGRTFLAVDRSNALKPRCVIKQLYPQQMGVEGKASALFRQEAEQLLRLGHYPSMPKFLDYFEQDGYQYLIQEFIEGQNLAEISATGRLFSEAEIFALLETLLETLEFLHYRNIIHRDVKPANIIETTVGRFVLVDLGAAKLMTGTALGQTGTVIGSAEYVAPEQLRGKAIVASDLYSLGATCISLLTGLSPFSLFDTSTGRWEWRDYLPQPVSDRLGSVLDRLLEGPTKLRYESADQVLRDLDLALERRSDVQSEEIDQLQREQVDLQVDEDRSDELNASFEQSGEVVSVGKKGDRKNVDRSFNMPLFIGGSALLAIFLSWMDPSWTESYPFIQALAQNLGLSNEDRFRPTISKIFKPVYLRPVKPFKTIENIPSFQAMALQDGGNTIVIGSIKNSELKLSSINALSGEGRAGYTSSKIQLNALFRGVNGNGVLPTKIYANKENMFVYISAENNYYGSLVKINIKNMLPSLPFSLPKDINQVYRDIYPVSNGESFNEFRNNDKSSTNGIWEIMDNGSLKKQKIFNDSSSSILSSDRKSIFRWIHSSSKYEVSILNLDKKTEQRISMPPDVASPYKSKKATNLFSARRGGEEYLIVQMSDYGVTDFLKTSQTLPSFYQSKALEVAKSGISSYTGSIYVWDITQKKLKYFLPCEGEMKQVAIAPDGRTLAISENGGGWPGPNNNYSRTLAISENGGDAPDPNKNYALSRITVWDLPTGQLLREVNINHPSIALAFTSDSRTLITGIQPDYINSTDTIQQSNSEISLWNVDELRNP